MKFHTNSHFSNLSKITFGGASIAGLGGGYGFGDISETDSIRLVHQSIEAGINCFDTAPIYGFGESEIRIGKAIKDRRDKVTITSKSGVSWHENMRVDMTNDPSVAAKQLEASLTRLNTDYIDIYMVHWPDKRVDIRKTLEVFQQAQALGKIKKIGLCNTNFSELALANQVCNVSVVQSELNIFNDQVSLLNLDENILKMSWGTFDKGIITGNVSLDRKFDKSDCRSWAPWWKKSNWKDKVLKIEKLNEIIKNMDLDLVTLAVKYNLNIVDTAICGFKNEMQLSQIIKAMESKVKISQIQKALTDAKFL
jgi:aryl-alcohol dehydrogenase-like predicted oxidoreductase